MSNTNTSGPFCDVTCPDPKHPEVCSKCKHRDVADRLEETADNAILVYYQPNTRWDGDEASRGHLYNGWLSQTDDIMYFDDRGPESMAVQLVKELRRVSRVYGELATTVERNVQALEGVHAECQKV